LTEDQNLIFFADKKALVLDKSSSIRSMLERVLTNIGVEKANIISLKNYDHAVDYIKNHKPEIIISDFEVHDRYGLDLIPYINEYVESPFEKIFVVVTENATDSSVADAAEEEVDGYLLKPFSSEQFEAYLLSIAQRKMNPSEYTKTILKGRRFLEAEKSKDARAQFLIAINQSDKPTLAYYYLGKIAHDQGQLDEALEYYQKALGLTPLHFKCLVGDFIIHLEQKKNELAYKKISHISQYYPLSPQLLKFALLLCITTYQYKDVERYFDRYMKLDRKPDDLKKVVSQALLTSGIDLLNNDNTEEALSYFLKGAVINGRTVEYLNKVIDVLIKNDMLDDADRYIGMFEPDDVGGAQYKQLLFKISAERNTYDQVLEEGKKLINSGEANPDVFIKVLDILTTTKNEKMLESIAYKAMDQFPNYRDLFKNYLPE
tara:strand:- start:13946 stop:15241 length:1296 start_codon:yes stop_codon:yes gene_type:complete